MIALVLAAGLTVFPAVDLLRLSDSPAGATLPPGWAIRPVAGAALPDFSIDQGSGESVLRIDSRGGAAWAYREIPTPLADGAGSLRWSWRALALPEGADLGLESADDSPLRVYVVFGKPTRLAGARAIFYSWGRDQPPGSPRTTLGSGRIAVVRMAGDAIAGGAWREETVNPFQDYRRFWPGEPPPIRVVGVMQDTDDTGSAASAELRALVWEPAPRAG